MSRIFLQAVVDTSGNKSGEKSPGIGFEFSVFQDVDQIGTAIETREGGIFEHTSVGEIYAFEMEIKRHRILSVSPACADQQ